MLKKNLKIFFKHKNQCFKKFVLYGRDLCSVWRRLVYCMAEACVLNAVGEARFCMAEVLFCMAEAHGSQEFSPSSGSSWVKHDLEQLFISWWALVQTECHQIKYYCLTNYSVFTALSSQQFMHASTIRFGLTENGSSWPRHTSNKNRLSAEKLRQKMFPAEIFFRRNWGFRKPFLEEKF